MHRYPDLSSVLHSQEFLAYYYRAHSEFLFTPAGESARGNNRKSSRRACRVIELSFVFQLHLVVPLYNQKPNG